MGLYDLDTAVDPMLSQTMGMNQSRDEILIEEKNMKDDDDALLVQVLDCYAGDRVVEFEFPRTLCLSTDDTVLDMKRRLDISSSDEDEIVVMCDEVDGSKSRSVKDKIVLRDSDVLLSSIPKVDKTEDEVLTLPIIYIQHMSRKKVATKSYSPILNDGIKIK